ncbi:NUDIX domain-containing protein [Candidatus Curtissbacteria bacterium]|nr:NUDIX domain-containing protein [Candidatus Curtissbacteria bacterium]
MAIKRIFSAGGIVVRDGKVLVTQHSKHKGWDFPKGHIETGESSEQTAVREVEEETGVKAEVVEKVGQTEYFYYEDKEKVLKTVVYFLMRYIGDGEATTAFEVMATEWLDPEEVEEKLTFKDTKAMWSKVKEKVNNLPL